jgi:hypothetical protein
MLTVAAVAGVAVAAAPLPLWQRMLLGGDYPGFEPQPKPPTELTLAAFAKQTNDFFPTLTSAQITKEMRADGYQLGVSEDLIGPQNRGGKSSVLWLGSPAGARRAANFFYADTLRPCRESCTVSAFEFKVAGIPGAQGARRVRFKPEGPKPNQQAFELYSIFFTSGAFAYGEFTSGPPNSINRGQFVQAAQRLYNRVKNSPIVGTRR